MSSTSKLLNVSIPAPRRSMFDLSRPNRSTIAPGLLYPMLVEEILPGDDINLSVESRLKSHATLAPILGMFDCTYYHFFCPMRNYVPDMNLNIKQTNFRDEFTLPTFQIPFNGPGSPTYDQLTGTVLFSVGAGSLLDYLGLPVGLNMLSSFDDSLRFTSEVYNALPLICYWDIWRNYFANPQAETVPVYTGFGHFAGEVELSHEYKELDVRFFDRFFEELLTRQLSGLSDINNMFFTVLSEYDFSMLDLFNNIGVTNLSTPEIMNTLNAVSSHAGLLPVTYHDDMFVSRLATSYVDYVKRQVTVDTSSGSFTIDSLRMANKLAKFIDKSLLGGTRYGQWLKSHFAVNGMEHLNIPIFLGMDRMSLFFDDVVSQADTGQGDNGELGATGGRASVHYPKTDNVSFYAKEHGYLMTLVALRPRVEYFQGVPKMYQKTQFSDIYVPELDAVGWQPILAKDMYANVNYTYEDGTLSDLVRDGKLLLPDQIVGYSPAWIEYMTAVGSAHGQFVSSLDYWVLLRRYSSRNANGELTPVDLSTYINPEDFNYAFAGTKDYYDNFYLNQLFNLTIGRNISKQILPTL